MRHHLLLALALPSVARSWATSESLGSLESCQAEYATLLHRVAELEAQLSTRQAVHALELAEEDDQEEAQRLLPVGSRAFYKACFMALLCVTMAALAAGLTMGLVSIDPMELDIIVKTEDKDLHDEQERSKLMQDQAAAEKLLPLTHGGHHQLLVTLLLMNSLANEALPLFLDQVVPSWMAVMLSVSFVLVFGEIIPSAVFTGQEQLSMAARFAGLVGTMKFLLCPIAAPIAMLLDAILGADHKGRYNFAELRAIVGLHAKLHTGGEHKAVFKNHDEQGYGIITTESEHHFTSDSAVIFTETPSVPAKSTKLELGEVYYPTPCKPLQGRDKKLAFQLFRSPERGREDLITFARGELTSGVFALQERDEIKIMHGVMSLTHMRADEAVVPLSQAYMLEKDQAVNMESLRNIDKHGHSRIPVFERSKHNVRGYILVKKLIVIALQFDAENLIGYTADVDGSISAWKLHVGQGSLSRVARTANAHSGRILAFNLDNTSKLLITAGVDKVIRAWQLLNGELQVVGRTSQMLHAGVLALAYDPFTGIVLSTGVNGVISAWRHQGEFLKPISMDTVDQAEGLLGLQFDAHSKVVVSAGIDGSVKAWKLQIPSIELVGAPRQAHSGWSRAMFFDSSSGHVGSCGDDGDVKAWKLEGEALIPLGTATNAHPDGARGVMISGKEKLAFSCGDDGVVKAWKVLDWRLEALSRSADAHRSAIFSIDYDRKQSLLLSSSMDGKLKAWQVEKQTKQLTLAAESPDADSTAVLSMKYSPKLKVIFSAGIDGAVRAWSVHPTRIELLTTAEGAHEGLVRTLALDTSSGLLVTAGEDGALRAWKLDDGKLLRVANLDEANTNGFVVIQFHGASRTVVAAGDDGSIGVWELKGDTFVSLAKREDAHEGVINSLQFDGSSGTIFTGGNSLRVWQLHSKGSIELVTELKEPFGTASAITALRYRPSSELLFGSSSTGSFRFWMFAGKKLHLLAEVSDAHQRGAASIAFDPTSRVLVTGGSDKLLRSWILTGGSQLERLGVACEQGSGKTFTACPKQGSA